ncbi:aminoglycoside phosphotransferase family protein [Roseibium sp. Sym1]|uniref:aminoglycoside phosphotransferase family protein n=1 Tax=Roseibium sp. Sym1 TaxID=3016006 RepID=UPI0022B55127|nr:aminoglycoside phosphotransferase family protein [Roseibium sp. Sym1]
MSDLATGSAFRVPETLLWLNETERGHAWLAGLPHLLESSRDRFRLDWIGDAFSGGNVSYVVPARRNGEEAVLKLQYPDRECRFEADALRLWNGHGAIRLLEHAPDLNALLLERCTPGAFLADDPLADHLGVVSDLLHQLLVPAGAPFTGLEDEARRWLTALETNWLKAGKPCEQRLVDAAVTALSDLCAAETDRVLLHQDLHGHNILSAERADWLAIDPKPLAGDPAFALSPIIRSPEFGHSRQAALYRLDRLSVELSLDRERARLWTIGQTMTWAFEGGGSKRHFETVRWLLG